MPQVTEAVYTNGILRPESQLDLKESQRVRLIVEPIGGPLTDREEVLKRLMAGIEGMRFFSEGKLPSRAELHDRV